MKSAKQLTNLTAGYLEREVMPRRVFCEVSKLWIAGRQYRSPSPPAEYLEKIYGDFWQPPLPEAQSKLMGFFDEWYLPALRDVATELAD